MGMLTLFNVGRDAPEPSVLLVVGVHREERAFGEAVAARLPADQFDLLRIEQGLCGRRPGPDELDAYRQRHRVLYEQILGHIRPAHRVVLDLHTGFDEAGHSVDALCADARLLRCVERWHGTPVVCAGSGSRRSHTQSLDHGPEDRQAEGKVRGVLLVAEQSAPDAPAAAACGRDSVSNGAWPCLRPEIPDAVWRTGSHLYIGLEVYLTDTDAGTDSDVDFAAAVVGAAAQCGSSIAQAGAGVPARGLLSG